MSSGSGYNKVMLEFVDKKNTTLGVMPVDEIHRQSLAHRSVIVLVHDKQDRVYIHKRSPQKRFYPGRWDVAASTHVLAQQAHRDSAALALEKKLQVRAAHLTLCSTLAADINTGWEFIFIYRATALSAEPRPNPGQVQDGMYIDYDEFTALIEKFPEQLTPALVHCFSCGLLWPAKG